MFGKMLQKVGISSVAAVTGDGSNFTGLASNRSANLKKPTAGGRKSPTGLDPPVVELNLKSAND